MATRIQPAGPTPHTAGIYADMTIDGPEIGTLVAIVDRAKNLPNRKTMGKQNPYCAARLGKEAKKTETDVRGGQTPRWDQELRFTVHDSPDYYNLKISIFSEDKRTDLIGEGWASLTDIIKPGGGRGDLWQSLTCKGKYAGELRIELTFYDSRPRPERSNAEALVGDLPQAPETAARVKRRPLPSNPSPGQGQLTPDTIPPLAVPVRAKHGPRDFRTPPRANTMPPESTPSSQQYSEPPSHGLHGHPHSHTASPVSPSQHMTSNHHHEEPLDFPQGYDEHSHDQDQFPDFLPELPPSHHHRAHSGYSTGKPQTRPQQMQARPGDQVALHHSLSAPSVPQAGYHGYDEGYQMRANLAESTSHQPYHREHLESHPRHSYAHPEWQGDYPGMAHGVPHEDIEDVELAPPPPPIHSNSAPVVPQYASPTPYARSSPLSTHGSTPSHARHQSVPNTSPLQNVERIYGQAQRTPPKGHSPRGRSTEDFTTPSTPNSRVHGNTTPHGQTPSPYGHPQSTSVARPLPHRHSVGGLYGASTPSKPHPLSHEVPRPRSPDHGRSAEYTPSGSYSTHQPDYQSNYRGRDATAVVKPRGSSPQPPLSSQISTPASGSKSKSPYSIQFPVRAFESSEGSPLGTSTTPSPANRNTPLRKSVSPQPSSRQAGGPSGVPFSPDSFDVHNPTVATSRAQVQGNSASPHSPFEIRPENAAHPRNMQTGPIIGWQGQTIDPSDHLPIDSWAPEPEKKTPTKTYGLGRDRDFGPRHLDTGHTRRISKDTVVNFRGSPTSATAYSPVSQSPQTLHSPSEQAGRNRLQKKSRAPHSPVEPLREHHNYNDTSPIPSPYDQQDFHRFPNAGPSPADYYGDGRDSNDALAREISSIDIGSGYSGGGNSRRSLPAPVEFVPVRSHRDRKSFY